MGALTDPGPGRTRRGAATPSLPGSPSSLWTSLRGLYQEYRRREASAFLRLIPREGIRPFYREARAWAAGRGDARGAAPTPEGDPEGEDALRLLERYALAVLPLPPFPVWVEDYLENRTAYLTALDRSPPPAERGDEVSVEFQRMELDGEAWAATLRLVRRNGHWRGSVAFVREADGTSARSAEIFCEATAHEVRERFRSFELRTLKAVLRSALP